MSKHTNKHWLREKEYFSLKLEYYALCDDLPRVRYYRVLPDTKVEEINRRFIYKFYDKEYCTYDNAPKKFRKMLNRIQRSKSKRVLGKIIRFDSDFQFEDNYKNAAWLYW